MSTEKVKNHRIMIGTKENINKYLFMFESGVTIPNEAFYNLGCTKEQAAQINENVKGLICEILEDGEVICF